MPRGVWVRVPLPVPRRSKVRFAPTFLCPWQKTSSARSLAPPFQITTACAGLRFGFGCEPGSCSIFSVSQIYGIIWCAVADASKLYLEKGISKKHAANSVIGACERYAERAKINGWDLTQYNRIKDLPQSELSLFYFNRVLGIGEMGFRVPPTVV